jgi:hypothetical protein
MSKIQLLKTHNDRYESADGHVMAREHGRTPNGNPMAGRWGLRKNGTLLDFDVYSNDLAERHNLNIVR